MGALYQRLIGPAEADLSEPVRRVHFKEDLKAEGFFDIHYGKHPLARRFAKILRLPPEGQRVPSRLKITPLEGGERWERAFGSSFLVTEQREEPGKLLAEKVGILEFWFRLGVEEHQLVFHQERARMRLGRFAVALPRSLSPKVRARCWSEGSDMGMRVRVHVTVPMVGDLLTYHGYIEEQSNL